MSPTYLRTRTARLCLFLGVAFSLLFVFGACQSRQGRGPGGDPASVAAEPVARIDQAVRMQHQMGQGIRTQSGF